MKTRKIIILVFAMALGYTSYAQTKFEKAQQGINTLVSIQETPIGGDAYFKVSLCDLTVISTGAKSSSVKVETTRDHYIGYIDKAELAGLVSGLKKMQKLLTDNPDKKMTYIYRLTGDLWFYATYAANITVVYENGRTVVNMDKVIKLLDAAKNGTPIED